MVSYVHREDFIGDIYTQVEKTYGTTERWVRVTGPIIEGNPYPYMDAVVDGNMPRVHEKDFVEVTGKFIGIDDQGYVMLSAIRVKNLGF